MPSDAPPVSAQGVIGCWAEPAAAEEIQISSKKTVARIFRLPFFFKQRSAAWRNCKILKLEVVVDARVDHAPEWVLHRSHNAGDHAGLLRHAVEDITGAD